VGLGAVLVFDFIQLLTFRLEDVPEHLLVQSVLQPVRQVVRDQSVLPLRPTERIARVFEVLVSSGVKCSIFFYLNLFLFLDLLNALLDDQVNFHIQCLQAIVDQDVAYRE